MAHAHRETDFQALGEILVDDLVAARTSGEIRAALDKIMKAMDAQKSASEYFTNTALHGLGSPELIVGYLAKGAAVDRVQVVDVVRRRFRAQVAQVDEGKRAGIGADPFAASTWAALARLRPGIVKAAKAGAVSGVAAALAKAADYRTKAVTVNDHHLRDGYLILADEAEQLARNLSNL